MFFSSSSSSASSSVSSSSSGSSTSAAPIVTKMEITKEDVRNYKETLRGMKGRKYNALAMHLITNETIYRVTMECAVKAIKILKKVISRGPCRYKLGSKTDNLVQLFKKIHDEYKDMILKMDIKMMPSKAEYLIECWLKRDAAQKAAQDYKDRKKERKAARVAAAVSRQSAGSPTNSYTQAIYSNIMKPHVEVTYENLPAFYCSDEIII
ncbi:hypothetical protein B9Z55_025112 [Caenorhabditis nigoni]|uniref:Uncharacterized protein n=1 Tax=Caenorhabditis nigoni TaxID=1611254 RepID=A0A2G5SXC4_9PELO|nr:hypothetical protein B9Z55_025112 [Caenorhabditis nigoni]